MGRILTAIAIFAGMGIPVSAQQTNLSGTWKLNLDASFTAGDHPARDYEFTKILLQEGRTIHQTDIATHVTLMNIPLPDTNAKMDLIADGQEHDAQTPGMFPGTPPAKLKITVEWQGGTLLVIEHNAGAGSASTTKRRYFVSEDGTHLIELIEAHDRFGDTEQRLVFDK